jgi:hypothetical protein
MKLRNSERDGNDISRSSYCQDTLLDSREENSAENVFLNKCYKDSKGIMQSTCSLRDAVVDNKIRRKERERLEHFHHMDDACFSKFGKSDDLHGLNISKQFTSNNVEESTYFKGTTLSCDGDTEILDNICYNIGTASSTGTIKKLPSELCVENCVTFSCPICHNITNIQNVEDKDVHVNNHIDICLNNRALSNFASSDKENKLFCTSTQTASKFIAKRHGNNSPIKRSNLAVKKKVEETNSILNYMINKNCQ